MSIIDTSQWGDFRIGELFEVVKGSRLTKAAMRGGDIRYVGASQFNNGVTGTIGNNDHLHPGNVLTVCYNGPVGTTFYQDEVFWASDDVNVLYPKFDMTSRTGMFIVPIIERLGSAYAYVDKWSLEVMKSSILHLPVTPAGDPDWDMMEQTMREVTERMTENLDALEGLAM